MKIGLFNSFGYDIEPNEKFRMIKASGFDCTSIWWDDDVEEHCGYKKELIPDIATKAGLIVENIHATMTNNNSIWLENINTEGLMKMYKESILACSRYNIPTIIMHPTYGSTPPKFNDIGVKNIKYLLDIAEHENVNIALENLHRPEYLDQIMSRITSDRLKLCYDSGHANCYADTDIIEKYPDKIIALHLHDNDGVSDQHMLPGKGIIDWVNLCKRLKKIKYIGPISFEVTNRHTETYDEYSAIEFLNIAADAANIIAKAVQE